jgi:hypothetical protein
VFLGEGLVVARSGGNCDTLERVVEQIKEGMVMLRECAKEQKNNGGEDFKEVCV